MNKLLHRALTVRNTIVLLVAALIGFGIWYLSEDWQQLYANLVDFFEEVVAANEALAIAVFTLLAAISAMMSFFTSTPLVPIANELWGRTATLAMLMTGWLVGSIFAYLIGVYLHSFIKNWKIFKRVDAWRKQLEGRTEFLVVFLFRFAMPAELASYTLGMLRYSFWPYVLITFLTELPFGFLAIYSSSALVEQRPFVFIGLLALGTMVIAVMAYFLYKRLRKLGGKTEELGDPLE